MIQNEYIKHLVVHQTYKIMCIICIKCHTSNRFSVKFQADLLVILITKRFTGNISMFVLYQWACVKGKKKKKRQFLKALQASLVLHGTKQRTVVWC